MASALPHASPSQASLLQPTHNLGGTSPLALGGIPRRGSPPALPQASFFQVGSLHRTSLTVGDTSSWGSPPVLTHDIWGCISYQCSQPVFAQAGRSGVDSIGREYMEALYQERNDEFLKNLSELGDIFVEPVNLSETLQVLRRGGASKLVIYDSDEELTDATNSYRMEDVEEPIIFESEKDKFVPFDFSDNEELRSILDE